MKLPRTFSEDIQSNNIQLIPLLIIERDDWATWFGGSGTRSDILISTHSVYISQEECVNSSVPNYYGDDGFPDGLNFEPLLLDTPVITEKIDFENRKYTTSKCTFKISNSPYNGKRFSDILDKDSLVGKKLTLAYKSIHSTTPVSSVYLDQLSFDPDIDTWGDAYDTYHDISPTFYFGDIIDIRHDNETVTITAEDLGSNYLHQQIPKNSLPNNSSIIESYRGAKIPMVYGYMAKSPVVVGANKKVYADSKPIYGWFRDSQQTPQRYGYPFSRGANGGDYSALFISIDDHYCCISDYIYYELGNNESPGSEFSYFNFSGYDNNPQQIKYGFDDQYPTKIAQFVANPLLSRSVAQLMVVYKPSKITLERRSPVVSWDSNSVASDSLGDGHANWGQNALFDIHGNPMGGDQLLEEEFEYMVDGNYESTHLLAFEDTTLANRSDAMVNSSSDAQIESNRFKHSLFRFTINTEPPIDYINRGGVCENAAQGTYAHWISFGHWVMPEQSINHGDASKHLYTYAKGGATDLSRAQIKWRRAEGSDQEYFYTDLTFAQQDSWANDTYLADIIRFSDFHNDPTHGNINEIEKLWHWYEEGGKSPLELYNVELINETGDNAWDEQYTNPYAKFENDAGNGKYYVQLGVYGFMSDLTLNAGSTNNFQSCPSISFNFDYKATMKGWLPEVNCMSVCDTKIDFKNMYGNVFGRVDDVSGNVILHPADIISDIFVNELGFPSSKIDQDSLFAVKAAHNDFEFSFTQKDEINSKDLIEDIAKSTFMFPRVGFDGTLKFPHIKDSYWGNDKQYSIVIQEEDIIKYSYNLTKRQDLRTGTNVKYNYDHQNDEYFGDSDSKHYQGFNFVDQILVSEDSPNFNGLEDIEGNIKDVESKYMRTEDGLTPAGFSFFSAETLNNRAKTIRAFDSMSTHHYRNRHLIIKCQLPLRYLDIEPGSYVRFSDLLSGVKAYGINYANGMDIVNNQFIYPLFMCTSIKKSIEYVEIECIQLHGLFFPEDQLLLHPTNPSSQDNMFSLWGNNIDPDHEYGQAEEDDEDDDDGEPSFDVEGWLEDIDISSEFSISPLMAKGFSFAGDIGLSDWEDLQTELPYTTSVDGLGLIWFYDDRTEGHAYIANGNITLNFNDSNAGANAVFRPDHFHILENGGSNVLTSWADLAPGDWTEVTMFNMNTPLLSIDFMSSMGTPMYRAILKNTNFELGGEFNYEWVLEPLFDSGVFSYIAMYNAFDLTPAVVSNHTNYAIKYVPPHPIHIIEEYSGAAVDIESVDLILGDINQDGMVNVGDVAYMIAHTLGLHDTDLTVFQQMAGDINEDGAIDALDLTLLINMITGNT